MAITGSVITAWNLKCEAQLGCYCTHIICGLSLYLRRGVRVCYFFAYYNAAIPILITCTMIAEDIYGDCFFKPVKIV
jgi:hypothetical protein